MASEAGASRRGGGTRRCGAGLTLWLLLTACSGEPAAPPGVEVTALGVWDEGGRANTLPELPVEHAGLRAWGLVEVRTSAGTHRLFDAAMDQDFDVLHEGPDDRLVALHAGGRVAVDAPPSERVFEANATLAADADGRLFAAWEEGSTAWGLGEALREERRIVAAASPDGERWFQLPLPADERLAAPLADDAKHGGVPTAPAGRCVEAPRMIVDEDGIPWLVYRWLTRWMPVDHARQSDGAGGANRRAAWRIRAMALTAGGWTAPADLGRSDGPADGGLVLEARPGGGLVARWYTDQRLPGMGKALAWEDALPGEGGWLAAELILAEEAEPPRDLAKLGPALSTRGLEVSVPADVIHEADDAMTRPALLFADLHRHTDASRCKIEEDGTLLDQVRYAVEVGGLDVLSVTNHFQHATAATWERERAFADAADGLACEERPTRAREWTEVTTLTRSWPTTPGHGRLTVLPGYERALPIGHWTMVGDPGGPDPGSLADAPFAPFRPRFLWDEHEPDTWLAMPHQIADRAAPLDWRKDSERAPVAGSTFEPLAELYQSRRGSYEVRGGWLEDLGVSEDGLRLVDYLDAGRRFGFAASSDHTTTSRAYTGIRLLPGEEPSRETVVAALRARRTFGSTCRLELDARIDGAPMGAVIPSDAAGLSVAVDLELYAASVHDEGATLRRGGAPDRIAAVELVKNGEVVHRWAGAALDDEGRRRGLLTLRVGRSVQDQRVELALAGDEPTATLGEALPFRVEAEDELTGTASAVALAAALDTRDEDGFTVPVAWEPGAGLAATFVHPKETTTRTEGLDALAEAGSTGVFRVRGGRAELRLDPPALGGTTFEAELELEDLAPGDWLYLRLRTERGEAAWCSPWFVE